MKAELSNDLSGIVEIDEGLILERVKCNHSKDKDFQMGRPSRRRGPKLCERPSMRRVRVLCCMDRKDGIFSQATGEKGPAFSNS